MNILQFIFKLLFKPAKQVEEITKPKQFFKKFSVGQFIHSDTAQEYNIDNSIKCTDIGKALIYTISIAERVRRLLGVDLKITSGYRCRELNKLVGGSKYSYHMRGGAFDFTCEKTPEEVCEIIRKSEIPFDQLIDEGTWTHISFREKPRRQFIDKS